MQWIINIFKRLYQAYDEFNQNNVSLLAGSAAYFLALSLFPMLSVLIFALGMFLQYTFPDENAETHVMRALGQQVSPTVAAQVGQVLMGVRDKAPTGGIIGIGTLVFAAIAGFAQFEQAFDSIWRLPQPPPEQRGVLLSIKRVVLNRFTALVLLLSIGCVVVITFAAATVMQTVQAQTSGILPAPAWVWTFAQVGISVALNVTAFTMLYKWLPKVRIFLLDAFQGACVAAVGWEIGRQALSAFLIGTRYSTAYGVVGTFIGLMLWCYYACFVIFFGAEYVRACWRNHRRADEGVG